MHHTSTRDDMSLRPYPCSQLSHLSTHLLNCLLNRDQLLNQIWKLNRSLLSFINIIPTIAIQPKKKKKKNLKTKNKTSPCSGPKKSSVHRSQTKNPMIEEDEREQEREKRINYARTFCNFSLNWRKMRKRLILQRGQKKKRVSPQKWYIA